MKALEALADPTRLRMVELLARRERSVNELVAEFSISQPGISRHLRVLRESGLVQVHEDGRRRVYSLDPEPLDELEAWLGRMRRFWSGRLDALERELARNKKRKGK
jgi:DNA-binding transcriptional ArsR family regulator